MSSHRHRKGLIGALMDNVKWITRLVVCFVCFKIFLLLCINMSSRRHRKGRIGALMDNIKWIT